MVRGVCVTVLVLSLTAWAYQSIWSAGWVYEDRAAQTSALQSSGSPFTQRSLTALTWQWTPTPRAAHAVNLALHVAIGGLIGLFAWRLGLTPLATGAAMTVWLLHPMTVELGAYAKARADQIALVGILVASIAAAGQWWRGWGLTGIVLGSLMAVGGKQAGVVVLLMVPLTIWHGRTRQSRPAPIPWWVPAVMALGLVLAGVQWYGGPRALVNADGEAGIAMAVDVTWSQWMLAQGGAVWYWTRAIVWPPLLTPDADVDSITRLARWSGLGLLGGLSGVAWFTRHRHPALSLVCAWVVCGVLPRLLIQTPRSYLSAAQFAVAFVGIALAAGLGAQRMKDQWASS